MMKSQSVSTLTNMKLVKIILNIAVFIHYLWKNMTWKNENICGTSMDEIVEPYIQDLIKSDMVEKDGE